ncbi:glycosyltransferase family 2 protein [Tenacibaculum finnmarkense]|uniref:glycosyltransferase family 2 protein n=1 Tax=Tenacibaculum finnmarkense TaxID=2781243 RepID=UPI000C433E02|nr:glycosyltransferase [Tenacibaculum finnmarkense]MCD8438968.1 glycosyltransferase [Tenacibaculum finnmarkense genomovar ulcerans]MCG8719992.1 glycosyltransferase [Tenacibaculum finnmarkense]MCG8753162.1 glycosyltransferase [Tenacibaculum finnmarkense]MCG8769883.1 glycosyltransferase [Tenacibaculum finnmarkense]MCG8776459.1 glycosyltransferase [Tenacibaculum finnmarkense]
MFLSIIIPVYNTPIKFLKECLDSLKLIPSSITSEIIIVNDGSKSEEILNYLSNLDENKYCLIHKKNGGPGSARNVGIKEAKGEYIFPLDADDILNDDFSLFISYLKENKSIDVLYGDLLYFGDIDKVEKNHEFNKVALWFENNIVPVCSFVRRDLWVKVGGFDEGLKTFEDYDFWIQCAVKGGDFKYLPMFTYKYRVIDNGVSRYQNTKILHKKYFKLIRSKIPLTEIKLSDVFKYIKISYSRKRTQNKNILIASISAFFRLLKVLKKIIIRIINIK